jgi:hypothetical protein
MGVSAGQSYVKAIAVCYSVSREIKSLRCRAEQDAVPNKSLQM